MAAFVTAIPAVASRSYACLDSRGVCRLADAAPRRRTDQLRSSFLAAPARRFEASLHRRTFVSAPSRIVCEEKAEEKADDGAPSPSGGRSTLVRVELTSPMGMILEEDNETGDVFVAELTPGGAAERSGLVQVGDIISKVMATFVIDKGIGKVESKLVDVRRMKLATVTGAIKSNVLARPDLKSPTLFILERKVQE